MANALVQMQKLANKTQVTLQKMVNSSNALQMKYNKEEAESARNWQTQMSKTAHQMEVEDLKKAGLNPVLSSGGSGAQSYTTSSASTQNDSGASAVAGVQSAQLGAIGSMESSRIQAAAQKAAAAQSAAAMRAAAASSAAATKYAADMNFATSKYKVDKNAENIEKQIAGSIKIARINKGATIPGQIEKMLTKAGIYGPGLNAIKQHIVTPSKNFLSKVTGNTSKYFSNPSGTKVTENNFKLSTQGRTLADNYLRRFNVAINGNNRRLVYKAIVFGNQNAYNTLLRNYASNQWKHANKSVVSRRGHR